MGMDRLQSICKPASTSDSPPIMICLMMTRKMEFEFSTRTGLRKKAHTLLHIALRLVSVVIYLMRRRLPRSPNFTAISILSQRLCILQVQHQARKSFAYLTRLSRSLATFCLRFPFDSFNHNQQWRASYDNYLFARPAPITELGQ